MNVKLLATFLPKRCEVFLIRTFVDSSRFWTHLSNINSCCQIATSVSRKFLFKSIDFPVSCFSFSWKFKECSRTGDVVTFVITCMLCLNVLNLYIETFCVVLCSTVTDSSSDSTSGCYRSSRNIWLSLKDISNIGHLQTVIEMSISGLMSG